jgi:hypothetical protein
MHLDAPSSFSNSGAAAAVVAAAAACIAQAQAAALFRPLHPLLLLTMRCLPGGGSGHSTVLLQLQCGSRGPGLLLLLLSSTECRVLLQLCLFVHCSRATW